MLSFPPNMFRLRGLRYFLDKDKKHVIKIHYKPFFRNFTIKENDIVIGKFITKNEALQGNYFKLSNGQQLFVRLKKYNFFASQYSLENFRRIEVLLDNEYVKGSAGHPDNNEDDFKTRMIITIGIVLFLGLVTLIAKLFGYEISIR